MHTELEFCKNHVGPLSQASHRYDPDIGCIAWRAGKNNSLELLHIDTAKKGSEEGRKLLYMMLDHARHDGINYVYGFIKVRNASPDTFYSDVGFDLQQIPGIYKNGRGYIFSQEFKSLLKRRDSYGDD